MKAIYLHDIFTDVLRNAGTPFRKTEIADIISRDSLNLKKDENHPSTIKYMGGLANTHTCFPVKMEW